MAVQQMAVTSGANLVEARRLRRIAAVATALAIEAILIASVVLSSVGVSPAWHPTPGGLGGADPGPGASGRDSLTEAAGRARGRGSMAATADTRSGGGLERG